MAYTDPNKTWTNEPLIAADLNTYLRDNMAAVKDPPSGNYVLDEGADYTTTSTSFVDVDATVGKLSQTIITNGGDVMVHFHGTFSGAVIFLNVDVGGAPEAAGDGFMASEAGTRANATFTRLITGLAAGSHTFKLQWSVISGTGTLIAGGTGSRDVHAQFWVREVS